MKIAYTFSGNLRTFLMPLRENKNIRLCDALLNNVIIPNNTDVFIYTDTNDFYFNNVHYFEKSKKIEILNSDASRIYDNIEFIEHDVAYKIIEDNLQKLFGDRLKGLIIEKPIDVSNDPKTLLLKEGFDRGCMPEMMVHQYRKLFLVYKMLEEYEKNNEIYDFIIKGRPDVLIGNLNVLNHDWNNTDIYVPGYNGSTIVFDWCAVGKRKEMSYYMNLFNNLGFTRKWGRTFKCQCGYGYTIQCDHLNDGKDFPKIPCPKCNRNDILRSEDITISAEFHLRKIFDDFQIKNNKMNTFVQVYRYRNTNQIIQENIGNMKKGELKIVRHLIEKNKVETII